MHRRMAPGGQGQLQLLEPGSKAVAVVHSQSEGGVQDGSEGAPAAATIRSCLEKTLIGMIHSLLIECLSCQSQPDDASMVRSPERLTH